MALQSRPLAGLLQPAYIPKPQAVFTPYLRRRTAPNDLSSLWPQHSSESLCLVDQLGGSHTKGTRSADNRLSRRFSGCTSGPFNAAKACPNSVRPVTRSGLANQPPKVANDTAEGFNFSGDSLGPMDKQEVITRRENCPTDGQNNVNGPERQNMSKRTSESGWSYEFCQFRDTPGQATFSKSSFISKLSARRAPGKRISSPEKGLQGAGMVAAKLSPVLADPLRSTNSFSHHGCVRYSLGCSIRRHIDIRNVGRSRKEPSLQCQGDDNCFEGSPDSWRSHAAIHGTSAVRQSHGCCLPEKRGRNQVSPFAGHNDPNFRSPVQISDTSDPLLHARQIQLPRRSPVAPQCTTRMAPAASMHREGFQEVRNPHDRPLRIRKSARSSQLCVVGSERPSSTIPQCLFPSLGLPTGMGISPTLSNSQGALPPQQCDRSLPGSSPQMGSRVLARRSEDSSDSSSLHCPQPEPQSGRSSDGPPPTSGSRNDTGDMESWGWSGSLIGWNEAQLKLLRSAWRPSTRKVYKVAWNRWLYWCQKHDVDPCRPTGSTVARFLADLHLVHKLSYNTVLLHKSVVATLSNVENAGLLSSHILVKNVLKSIALRKPVAPKPPIWNIDSLSSFLEHRNVSKENVFATCSHTATLLLLCSGRRVHDLTLLAVDPDHFTDSNDSIVLWPIFGSKTDNATYRQSGWKLFSTDTKNLDPVYWIRQTVSILDSRRKLAKCNNLFVNIRGQSKAASRTVIAGWVKSVLTEAGILSSAGSLRSAVASKNWDNNYPLDEILARGNWRSSNTFSRFYKREVMPASVSNSNSITRLFNPVK